MAKKTYVYLGISLWILTVIFAVTPIWPYVFYRLSPGTSDALASTIGNLTNLSNLPNSTNPKQEQILPPFDPSLPEDNGIIIDKIGVRGQIHEGDDWDAILKTGVWRVPDFGIPEDSRQPMILAAHRWGYVTWTNSFRTLNSFYNLPKLAVGDQIEVIWNQRKYIYEIYASETGDKISDYSANLILYTCELWNSPVRIFKYAKRIT
ncbi:sortase [Candidatus Collierbacteria bacterium]|nr:sortase [Candidatus Collierbacteria bacterium]